MVFVGWYINWHLQLMANIKQWWDLKFNKYIYIRINSISLAQSLFNRYWLSNCSLFRLSTNFCQPVNFSSQYLNIIFFILIHISFFYYLALVFNFIVIDWLEWLNSVNEFFRVASQPIWFYDKGSKCGGQTNQHLCSVTGHKLGPLIANRRSIILMGAGLLAEDLGVKSPLCRYQLTKYADSQNMGAAPGPCL